MNEASSKAVRYRFVESGGRRILVVDYAGLTPEQHVRAMDPVRDFITSQPAASLRVLHLANDRFTAASADAIKHYTRCIDRHVLANAVVCRSGFRVAFNAVLNTEVRHEIRCFEREPDAAAWLLGYRGANRAA